MLRISSDKSEITESNLGGPSVLTTAGAVATGGLDHEAPTFDDPTSSEPKSTQKPIKGNNAAHVLPWLTEEIRFHAALDMGSCDGSAVKLLQEAGYDGHGIDIAPTSTGIPNIETADFFHAPYENNFFDVVICCNVLQDIPNHRVSEILAEINRLSNSYIMITTPSTECDYPQGETREIAWWCERIRDFGWRYRIIREDPESGHLVILAEKPNSLAAQILPLIDGGELDASAVTGATDKIIAKIDLAVESLESGQREMGFTLISQLADLLLNADLNLAEVQPLFTKIITAMENQDVDQIIHLMRHDLRNALTGY
ncbi:MAG: hypothetical protein ACI97A_003947 [Planctomycetota bacterium]|jgi:hypothetical protein